MEKSKVRPGGDKKYFCVNDEKILKINDSYIEELKKKAKMNGFNRCTMCLHDDINAKVHEMINVMSKYEYIRPHSHPFKTETKIMVEGELLMVIFDECGNILDQYIMQSSRDNGIFTTRIDMGIYHTNIPLKDSVFHEVITGPYIGKDDSVFPEWAPEISDKDGVADFMKKLGLDVFYKIKIMSI
ncbi:MAG: WbuC family cupin fold metalloprotein [Lachnospiraceae bacterium]|nr:WbuC family cupin fold metalloprotein [Lachnospiraceae bacterium]